MHERLSGVKIAAMGDPGMVGQPPQWSDAFRHLYETRRVPMVKLAYLLTGGDSAAEELVQDAFLRVRDQLPDIAHPAAYLRRAVVNACMSHARRVAVEHRALVRLGSSPPTDDHPDELRDALLALPRRQHAAVVLRYYADLPEAEIASTLGCSVPAVKSLLHHALTTLQGVIER